jgi:hypothetical protein
MGYSKLEAELTMDGNMTTLPSLYSLPIRWAHVTEQEMLAITIKPLITVANWCKIRVKHCRNPNPNPSIMHLNPNAATILTLDSRANNGRPVTGLQVTLTKDAKKGIVRLDCLCSRAVGARAVNAHVKMTTPFVSTLRKVRIVLGWEKVQTLAARWGVQLITVSVFVRQNAVRIIRISRWGVTLVVIG